MKSFIEKMIDDLEVQKIELLRELEEWEAFNNCENDLLRDDLASVECRLVDYRQKSGCLNS